jgi:hypothetical protein
MRVGASVGRQSGLPLIQIKQSGSVAVIANRD